MTKLQVLCVGAGYFSQFHLDAWTRIPEVELAGICDREQDKAAHAGERFGIRRVFTDVDAALEAVRPDFVDIITPPDTHLELVGRAAEFGSAIICQKPLAPDFPTAHAIGDVVRRAGVPFMVHENFRFQPWHREIKRLLSNGAIGRKLHYVYFRSRPGDGWGPDAYLDRQPYFRLMPRLLVHETGVHFIDTFRFLAGEIDQVYAVLRRLNPVIQGEDAGLLTFRFANGAVGVWDANRCNECNHPDPRYTFGEFLVECDGGTIRMDLDGGITIQPLGGAERRHDYAHEHRGFGGDCVYFTQRHFVQQLLGDHRFETGVQEYLKTLAVQEAAYRSAELGRPVRPATIEPRSGRGPARRIIDLTLPIDDRLRGASVAVAKTIMRDGWNATTLTLYSHCGTHMDAPRHFLDDADGMDRQSLEACCGPAKVLDLTPVRPRELLGVDRFAPWADQIQPGDRLLVRTDWHRRVGTDEYRNQLPRLSVELARWLVERRVALVGVEPPSVADVNDREELTAVHHTLLGGGVAILEGLAHLDCIRRPVVQLIALPLKITDGDGSPVRAIAIETADA